ncbi:speckle-type POZ protein-like B [Culex quinquefasciatus]|uniref:speckle-type POZ protein-like B n=1 Tax=Culex quinquefasciatus TaxID=7176 RepID=UPI0018E2B087|nr:speckle-type POZ protein-like B [Culex quinquefasciatus]
MSSAPTKKVRVQESSSVTFFERKAFKFTWTIKEFSSWTAEIGPCMQQSAVFPSGKEESIHIADDFGALVDGQRFGDVTVKVGDKRFRVYKGILASRSPVFAAMFEHSMKEKIKSVVTIVDVEPDVFHELLRYIYTDKVQNLTTLAYQLFAAADKYDIGTLKTLCRMSILANISTENATDALKCADLHLDSEMKRHTLEFLRKNSGSLLAMTETAGWKAFELTFPHLAIEVLKAIVKS